MNLDQLRASDKAAVTVTDVARLLELDERTVRRACEDGDLPHIQVGRRVLLPRLPLLALLGATPINSEGASATDAPIALTDQDFGGPRHGSECHTSDPHGIAS